jgi:hypothetical protein
MHPLVEQVQQHTRGQKLPPPVSDSDIAEAERRLGFPLPDLLRELYTTIADGGFGPSGGLLPLLRPVPETKLMNGSLPGRESVVELYEAFRVGDPEDETGPWPDRLLPIVDHGCAIRSCVDCSTPALAIVYHEPYVSRTPGCPSLERWLREWIASPALWKLGSRNEVA